VKHCVIRWAIAWVGLVACFTHTGAAMADEAPKVAAPTQPSGDRLVYRPPDLGAPKQRVGGGTRSLGQLFVLSPPHLAQTSLTQPRLYWYLDPGFRNALRFRLERSGDASVLLNAVLEPAPDGGVQYVDLSDYDLRLEVGARYEWGVILEPEPHQRWPALYSTADLLVTSEAGYARGDSSPRDRALEAARMGLWYDALDLLSRQIEADPATADWRQLRAELLDQGGLGAVAERDRRLVEHPR
jgi:hypothetical protein